MSTFDFQPDTQTHDLDVEWRRLHAATVAARSNYRSVSERLRAAADLYEKAREDLEILEILEARSRAALESRLALQEHLPVSA